MYVIKIIFYGLRATIYELFIRKKYLKAQKQMQK